MCCTKSSDGIKHWIGGTSVLELSKGPIEQLYTVVVLATREVCFIRDSPGRHATEVRTCVVRLTQRRIRIIIRVFWTSMSQLRKDPSDFHTLYISSTIRWFRICNVAVRDTNSRRRRLRHTNGYVTDVVRWRSTLRYQWVEHWYAGADSVVREVTVRSLDIDT